MKICKLSVQFFLFFCLIFICCNTTQQPDSASDASILSHIVDLSNSDLRFYQKDENGTLFKNHGALESWLNENGKKLRFAMNGGMYLKDFSPQGLYIEDGITISALDTIQEAYGNFYLQPNGVFYLTKEKEGVVCQTKEFIQTEEIAFATQSGPMLLIEGETHPVFKKGSSHLHIRNGVGVLPDGKLLFAISKEKINLYDFADFFKQNGCKNALYLDGFVSKVFLPEKKWKQVDGAFGIIIAETF